MITITANWLQNFFYNKGQKRSKEINLHKFGTFFGVFVPCILMLFGVIIFLRLGWIVGQVGLSTSLVVMTFAALIAFITCLSMAAISTNIEVGKGGVYYMLSRSLGIEAGSAVGLPLFLKQSLSIAFCVIGFAESLNDLMPSWPIQTIGICTLGVLTILAYTSVRGALKVQLFIFVVIIGSLISLFTGNEVRAMHAETFIPAPLQSLGFWTVFAMFFPAMTGLESSVSLSGDLRNPSRSLPIGTISAIVTAYVVYIAITIFLISRVPLERLVSDPLIMQDVSSIPSLIILGIWGATLSSALGGLIGAPRTLQAIADDGIVPKIFGKTYGKMDEPRVATLATFLLALVGTYFGSINYIAPLLTMICLICYAVLNLSAGIETLMANPSWRPRFRVHWSISICGAALCVIAMLMIDAGAALISLGFVAVIFMFVTRRKLNTSWEDIRQGLLLFISRIAIYQLAYGNKPAKSWRPHFLVFTKSSEKQSTCLLKFSEGISHSKGFLTMVSFITKGVENREKRREQAAMIAKRFKDQKIEAFVQIKETDEVTNGMKHLIENYGLGPLTPNTIVFGGIKKEDNAEEFISVLHTAIGRHYNIVISNDENSVEQVTKNVTKNIHIWWDDQNQENSNLMLVLASMLQRNPAWKKSRICLKVLAASEIIKQGKLEQLQKISIEKRLPLDIEVYVTGGSLEEKLELVKQFSNGAEIVLYSLAPPTENREGNHEYAKYLLKLSILSDELPTLTLVLSSEHTPLESILK